MRRAARFGIWIVPLAAFVHGLGYAWGRTGELTIDWGRELEIARELTVGRVLYRDCQYWYGPVAPYVNSFLFRAFGTHAEALMVAGLASAAVMTLLLGGLGARFGGPVAGATVATVFVYTCAFGHYLVNDIFNWATPYTYAAPYGMVAATASLACLVRHVDTGRRGWLAASQALLVVAALTKLEPAFAAALAHAAFVSVSIATGRAGRRLVAGYAAAALVFALALGLLSLATGGTSYVSNITSQLSVRNAALPIAQYMGLASWRRELGVMMISAARLGAALVPVFVVPFLRGEAARRTVAGLGAVLAFAVVATGDPLEVLRAVPLVVVAGLAFAIVHVRRDPAALAALLVWAFAAGALARLPLAAGAHHYGFYLLPVPLAALLLWYFGALPRWRPTHPFAATCTAVGLAAGLAWGHSSVARTMWAEHTTPIVTPRGSFLAWHYVGRIPVGEYYAGALERLRAYPPGTSVMAAPDGIAIPFFAGQPSWGRRYTYYPPEVGGDEGDTRLAAELAADPPNLVLLMNVLNLDAYGVHTFGIDYARASVDWMRGRYDVDRIFGPRAVVILRRRDLPAPP